MTRLAGQVALITDASCGLGAAVARRFAAEGACVVIQHDGEGEGAARVVADIIWRGGCAMAVDADLAHWPDVRRLFDAAAATFGGLDMLVNAGAAQAPGDLFGAMLICQEAIRLFGEDGGVILQLGPPDALTLGLSRAVARSRVRVHAIAPQGRAAAAVAKSAADRVCAAGTGLRLMAAG